ncbi:MAG TPA: hypothetical protein VGK87_17855 [Anaerolineae bacterium]
MDSVPSGSTVQSLRRVGASWEPARATQRSDIDDVIPAPRVVTLWREAITAVVNHFSAVLVMAWGGFAAIFIAIQAFQYLSGLTPSVAPLVFLVAAAAALLVQALAQGALTWIGLPHPISGTSTSMLEPLRAAISNWPRLLPGALVYAVASFVGALCLTPLLMNTGLLTLNVDVPSQYDDSSLNLTTLRSLDAMSLGILHPAGAWLIPLRTASLPVFMHTETPDPDAWIAFEIKNHMDPSRHHEMLTYVAPMAALPASIVAFAGLMLILANELLLGFNAAATMSTKSAVNGLFGPTLDSIRIGLRNTRLVLKTGVSIRLLIRMVQAIGLILTTSVAVTTILPAFALSTSTPWVVPVGNLACIAGSAAVSALLAAFCALYDARLYVAVLAQDDHH